MKKPDATCPCEPDGQDALRVVLEGVATETGERFFEVLAERLSSALETRYAWVTELMPNQRRLRTLAFCSAGRLEPPFEIDIDGTPCQAIIEHARFVHYPDDIRELFPASDKLKELGAVSYMGVPLLGSDGRVLGHLAVIDDRPMPEIPRNTALFRIFGARAAAELARIRTEKALQHRETEWRTLVDSAMDGIVELDDDLRMVRMNPAARDLFGLPPDAGAGGRLFDYLAPASRETLSRLVARIDALPRDKRFLWVPGGLDGSGADGKPFAAEATFSRFEMEGRRYLTLILRDVNDRVEAERQISRLRRETEYLREEIRSLDDSGAIVGKSRALQSVLDSTAQVAGTDTTVLIQGETGTGKELVAGFVHRRSRRARGAFVKLNCAALQQTLVESEFFGHEAGAFTGATQQRKGRFELADGGTLFLDEVSEIPMEVQAKLLRVLQEGQFERVGASRSLTVDVRVVAATNRKLNKAMVEGTFRADLFYRLNVYPIQIPPLRERREDIPVLVHHFVSRIASKMGKTIRTIPADAMNALTAYDWPGNVRELKNVLERAVITSTGPALRIGDTLEAPPVPIRSAKGAARFTTLAALERCYIAKVLSSTGWRISGPKGAAAVLGLNPSTLRYRIQKLKIRKPWATGAGPNPPLGGGEGRSPNVAHR